MKDILQKTWQLFWRFPVLWLPCLIVSPAAFVISLARSNITRRIEVWSFVHTTHSVLGGSYAATDFNQAAQLKALLFNFPFTLIEQFISVLLYIGALLVTARMVESLITGSKADIGAAFQAAVASRRDIRVLALKFILILGLAALAINIGVIELTLRGWPPLESELWQLIVAIEILISAGPVAWFLTPAVIRFLQPQPGAPISAKLRIQCVALALAACEIYPFLSYAIAKAELKASRFISPAHLPIAFANYLVLEFVDIPAFIVLALIARAASTTTGVLDSIRIPDNNRPGLIDWIRRARTWPQPETPTSSEKEQ